MKCCPACGQTLPLPLNISDLGLRGQQIKLFLRVHRAGQHGISAGDLVNYMYDDDPNGGPVDPKNVLSARISILNRRLKSIGKMIRAGTGSGGTNYVLKDLPQCK